MKSKTKFMKYVFVLLLVLLTTTSTVWARANDATYSPENKIISGEIPFTESYAVTFTSPSNLNRAGDEALITGTGICLNVNVSVQDNDGTSNEYVLSLLADDLSLVELCFTALSQQKTFTVNINVPGDAAPGDYVIKFDTGTMLEFAWGAGGGSILTLSIAAPTTEPDTTAPIVAINEPVTDAAITYCSNSTPINIAFEAFDAESDITDAFAEVSGDPVTDLTVDGLGTGEVSAIGTYNAEDIGIYILNAHATSSGGTGDASSSFSLNYNVSWLPPLSLGKTRKGGSTIPIKFTVRDCNGNFVYDERIGVAVIEITETGEFTKLNGVFGEGASGIRIDDMAGQYILDFQTDPGVHNYRAEVYFMDFTGDIFLQGSKDFMTR